MSQKNPAKVIRRRFVVTVIIFGLAISGGLTYASRTNYLDQEQHLTELQSKLLADAIATSPIDIERRLGVALAAAALSENPAHTFGQLIGDSLTANKGPFSSAGLAVVTPHGARNLLHIGVSPLGSLDSASAQSYFRRVARTPVLQTGLVAKGSARRLSFGLSQQSRIGVLVAYATEVLPADGHFTVPRSNPESAFNIAIYLGTSATPGTLLLTNARTTPLTGTVSVATVPFGSTSLTIVSDPRTTIAGAFAQNIPWGILAVGLLLTALVAALVDRLRRRQQLEAKYTQSIERLYTNERTVAQTLQHALVPPSMPNVRGLEFAARYMPWADGVEVGGDWYDVIPIGRGVVVSVGDVSGKGLPAASMMAALRFAIRAHATYGLSPGEILTQLAARRDYVTEGHFATVVCARLDPVTGIGVVASAGHLPPIYQNGAAAHVLHVVNGPPLGVKPTQYTEQIVDFSAGSMVLLYTDGLIERRGTSLDTSINQLAELCNGQRPLDGLLEHLVETLITSDSPHDDVAVLAVGRTS